MTLTVSDATSIAGGVGCVAIVMFIGCTIWVYLRTRSSHALTWRVWRWFTDKQEVADPTIRAFLDGQNSLMTFRFMSGLKPDTIDDAHFLINAIQARKLDFSDVRAASGYINPTPVGIETKHAPTRWWLFVQFIFLMGLLMLALTSVAGMASNGVFLKFDGGKWFRMDEGSARLVRPGTAVLTPDQCPSPLDPQEFGFRAEEINDICISWSRPRDMVVIRSALASQRIAFGVLAGASLLVGLSVFVALRAGEAARRIRRKLEM